MDPIRTIVKYWLMPLRIIVDIGDRFVSQGEYADVPRRAATEPAEPPMAGARPRRAATQATQRAARPARQASRIPKDLDDVAIARKVETIIFRDNSVPKGHIDVNCVDGTVWLRGQAKTPDMIRTLEHQTAAIPEVRQVENMLHLPKTPAPTRTDTPARQRRTRRSTKSAGAAARKVANAVTNEGEGGSPTPPGPGSGGNSEPVA